MEVRIIGTETLGVRGLSCFLDLGKHKYLIDPGVALGFTRYGLHPHPLQAAFSEMTKIKLVSSWSKATDVIITHFHGDHIPLYNANPFQFPLRLVEGMNNIHVWACKPRSNSYETRRATEISSRFKTTFIDKPKDYENVEFSYPYPHGLNKRERVMMVKVGEFVQMSDTQLLVDSAIDKVCSWSPRIVFTDGPPIYRYLFDQRKRLIRIAYRNALRIANCTDYLIIDHHISRCYEGIRLIDKLRRYIGNRVMCAADYMKSPRLLLEAWRKVLYEVFPYERDWFILKNYKGEGEMAVKFKKIIESIYKLFPKETLLTTDEVRALLRKIVKG